MSFFNKGFSLSPVRSFFNKTAGGARSLFNKTPGAFRAISGGLGQASRASNPGTYSGQSPAAAASSAIEKAKSLGRSAQNMFV